MLRFFFDTSAFAKRYHPEVGSNKVTDIFGSSEAVLQVSNLGILETQSAFGMKVRTQQITSDDAVILRQRVLSDVADGIVKLVLLNSTHVTLAGTLVAKYGFTRRMRTLDALQLAVALDLRRRELLDTFVVADRLLAEIATLEGLATLNPEDFP